MLTYLDAPLTSNVKRSFKTVLSDAGIENCTLHTLRHTFASHLAMQGVPLAHIGKLLGHTDTRTTQIYAHLSDESVRDQVKHLGF